MITQENEFYIRFILLLIKGGTGVLRTMFDKELEKKGIQLDEFLSSNKAKINSNQKLTRKQKEILYPQSSNLSDLEKWDITLLAYVLIEFFLLQNSSDFKAVDTIRMYRNDFHAHQKSASIEMKTYMKISSKLSNAITTLSYGFQESEKETFKNIIESMSSDTLDMNEAVETLKSLDRSDEFFENIQIRITQIDTAVQTCHQEIIEMKQQIAQLQNTFEDQGNSSKIVHTVFGSVRVSALDQRTVDTAEKVLLSASNEAISQSETSQVNSEVRAKADTFVNGITELGVQVVGVSEGSIVFRMECRSLEKLLILIDYFDSDDMEKHLEEIAGALMIEIGQKLELHAFILSGHLKESFKGQQVPEYSKTLRVAMQCTGVEGLQTALDVFEGDGAASNSLNGLQEAISKEVGSPVTLNTSINVSSVQTAINAAAEDVASPNVTEQDDHDIDHDVSDGLGDSVSTLSEADISSVNDCLVTNTNNADQQSLGLQNTGEVSGVSKQQEHIEFQDGIARYSKCSHAEVKGSDEVLTDGEQLQVSGSKLQKTTHRFLLYSPTEIKSVVLVIGKPYKNKYNMNRHWDKMYEVSIELPLDKTQTLTYKYEIQYEYMHNTQSHRQTLDKFKIGSRTVHRDITDNSQCFQKKYLLNHFLDILVCERCHHTFPEKELFEQIGHVSRGINSLKDETVEKLIRQLCEGISVPKQYFLLLVIFAYMCVHKKHTAVHNAIVEVDKQNEGEMLSSLSERHLNSIPVKAREQMPFVCLELSRLKFGEHWCCFAYLESAHSFYGDEFAFKLLKDYKNNLYSAVEEHYECGYKLCRRLYDDCFEPETHYYCQREQMLVYVLNKIPLKAFIYIYNKLKLPDEQLTEDEARLQKSLKETAIVVVDKSIIDCKRDLKKVIGSARVVCGKGMLSGNTEFCRKFEIAIVDKLKFCRLYVPEDIDQCFKALIESTDCFSNMEQQEELINRVIESDNSTIFNLFISLFHIEIFRECYVHLDVGSFERWLTSGDHSSGRVVSANLEQILKRFNEIRLITKTIQRDDVDPIGRNAIMKELKLLTPQDLFQNFRRVERQCDANKDVGTLFKTQVEEDIARIEASPIELLTMMFGSAEALVADSRIAAEIICVIIERFLAKQPDQDDTDYFFALTNHTEFLHIIKKANGQDANMIRENEKYRQSSNIISNTAKNVADFKISLTVLTRMEKCHNAIKLLQIDGKNKETIDQQFRSTKERFDKGKDSLQCILEVLDVLSRRANRQLHLNWANLKDQTTTLLKTILDGHLAADICKQGKMAQKLGCTEDTFDLCADLKIFVKSETFWNLGRVTVENCFLNVVVENQESAEIRQFDLLEIYLRHLKEKGIHDFNTGWSKLEENTNLQMDEVLAMFGNADIVEEIKMSEECLGTIISPHTKTCLEKLSTLEEMNKKLEAMKSMLYTFYPDSKCDNSFQRTVSDFKQLLPEGKISQYSFREVQNIIGTVSKFVDEITEDTLNVMSVLGESSHLLQFLTEIANEDIRTLIDAVEYISEQHIQETTVSALVDVERFVHPILEKLRLKEQDFEWLFKTIKKQVEASGKDAKTLHLKIADCNCNIHNLKSLCNKVENRGEQTKEVVTNVTKNSKIKFVLDTDNRSVFFQSVYEDGNVKDEATLLDYRSRALLLMNTERNLQTNSFNREEFKLFNNAISLCTDIKRILSQLVVLGHISYTNYENEHAVSTLQHLKESLESDFDSWFDDLQLGRAEFYLLNFVRGFEIPVLFHFLEHGKDGQIVETVLKSIHPFMRAEMLSKAYPRGPKENRKIITSIGSALHTAHSGLGPFSRNVPTNKVTALKMSDIVYNGRVRIVNLEEKGSVIFRTVLALYRNTTQKLPESHQLLICKRNTQWDEVSLLIERCLGASKFYGQVPLFCLACVENLERDIQDKLVQAVNNIPTASRFLLAVICKRSENLFGLKYSDEMETVCQLSDKATQHILKTFCPHVFIFSSEIAGLGKSTTIYKDSLNKERVLRSLHISGDFSRRKTIETLQKMNIKQFQALHIDIGVVSNPGELDIFLSEMILLQYISDNSCSLYLHTKHISIEISNDINNELVDSLDTVTLFQRKHLTLDSYNDFVPSHEINSPVQVVCHYLKHLSANMVDKDEIHFSGELKAKPLPTEICQKELKKFLPLKPEPSFNTIHIFLNVLSEQLKRLSVCPFFKIVHIDDMVAEKSEKKIRSTLVHSMVKTALEFSNRSVRTCKYSQVSSLNKSGREESSTTDQAVARTKGMIRWEESNHLIFVFHQGVQGVTPMYRDVSNVDDQVRNLFEAQMNTKLVNYKDMKPNELQSVLLKLAQRKTESQSKEMHAYLDTDYALTPDNVLKMVLILMRLQSRVPVILMGETGCGKTSLVRYLSHICQLPFDMLPIHAGVASDVIVNKVMNEHEKCHEDLTLERLLFLDEVNTSENIGLISDIICHHRCGETLLAPNLVILAACNPYILKTESEIKTSGLEGKINMDNMSRLVYRVYPLPEPMVDYVWDFGSLSNKDEEKYIQRMIENVFPPNSREHDLFTELISVSQSFVRNTCKSDFTVSLRDVYRTNVLVQWFTTEKPKTNACLKKQSEELTECALILALAHCYHCRFSREADRQHFRNEIAVVFKKHGYPKCTEDYIGAVIKNEQIDILERMAIPAGIAKNTAVRENVFMLFVCILNRIPIFLVGKPGCSKSLAIQLIRSNLRGKDSSDPYFRTLPQLHCVSFQGSESSTSDGIIKVFEKAEKYQKSYTNDDILSVVILDEIGLAEISVFNPLKVLHSLLEPERGGRPNVAVVGISNWALDASKMNRAIHLSRPDMGVEELIETGTSISKSFTQIVNKKHGETLENKLSTDDVADELHNVAKSYIAYTNSLRFRSFYGLRDFYSLVKFITRTLADRNTTSTAVCKENVIMEGIQRNFGGLPNERVTLLYHFQDCFRGTTPTLRSTYHLVYDNVKDSSARHLMLITRSESVLAIVETILKEADREKKEIIFGSQFEEDLTDDYNYRILNRIIMCMEQGLVLVLKDLEKIYGSLYDMLNQNYTRIGKKNNCRVALGPYSNPFAHVSESFRCIVIVDERKLDFADPPFLNRFEKQYLTYIDMISQDETVYASELEDWLDKMSIILGKPFGKEDVLPIYNEELVSTLVMHKKKCPTDADFVNNCKDELMWLFRPEAVVRLTNAEDIGIQRQSDKIAKQYFSLPLHEGITKFVQYEIGQMTKVKSLTKVKSVGMTIIFTNSSIYSKMEYYLSGWKTQFEKLQTFKSEKQLSSRIQLFYESEIYKILFLQCSATEDDKHIMLCKTIIERFSIEWKEKETSLLQKQVYLVVHLDDHYVSSHTVSQINYLSGWKLVMIDSLEPKPQLLYLCSTDLVSIVKQKRPLCAILKNELFWAFTRIQYGSFGRDTESIGNVLDLLKNSDSIMAVIEERIVSDIIIRYNGISNSKWQFQVAFDITALKTSTNFTEALERFILNAIKRPLAKIVFRLELMGAFNSYFISDKCHQERRRLWEYELQSEQIVSTAELQDEFGPCCYICERSEMSLAMPFSRVIFEYIEAKREDFLEEMSKLRSQCLADDNEILPADIMRELVYQLENYIFRNIPDIQQLAYENMKEDYISDFCKLVSFTTSVDVNSDSRHAALRYTKCAIKKKMQSSAFYSDSFAGLHLTFWAHAALFRSILHLIQISVDVTDASHFISFEEMTSDSDIPPSRFELQQSSENTYRHLESGSDDVDAHINRNSEDEFSHFVASVCSSVIPTTAYLQTNKNIPRWQLSFRNILAVAPGVSSYPAELYALRFCDDFLSQMRVTAPVSELGSIGDVLSENALDSENTYKTIISQIQQNESVLTESGQRLISLYIFRCLQANSETVAYNWFFDLIEQFIVIDEHIGVFRYLLYFYLQLELDSEILIDLVTPGANYTIGSGFDFLSRLDKCLENTLKTKGDSEFSVLIIDLLQERYDKIETSDYNDLLSQSGTILQTGYRGLKLIAALAMLKSAMCNIRSKHDSNVTIDEHIMCTLNSTFAGIADKEICKTMKVFLIKEMVINLPLYEVVKQQKDLAVKHDSLTTIQWTESTTLNNLDSNPLSVFVPKHSKYRKYFTSHIDERHIQELLQCDPCDFECLISIFSLLMRDFYLVRLHTAFQDTERRRLDAVLASIRKCDLSKQTIVLMESLLKPSTFCMAPFSSEANTNTKPHMYLTMSVLVSLYALSISAQQVSKDGEYRFMVECLKNQCSLTSLSGFSECADDKKSHILDQPHVTDVVYYECKQCRLRLALLSQKKEITCPICKQNETVKRNDYNISNSELNEGRAIFVKHTLKDTSIRKLSPVTYQVLSFLIKGNRLGSFALGFASKEEVVLDECNVTYLWEELVDHWKSIAAMLNFDDYTVGAFLIQIMYWGQNRLFQPINPPLKTATDMESFVKGFDSIVNDNLTTGSNKDFICLYDESTECTGTSIEHQIRETDCIASMDIQQRIESLPCLFRSKVTPSIGNLLYQLKLDHQNHNFLEMVITSEYLLSLPLHIHHIIQWHLITVANTCYTMKTYECSNMTIQSFLDTFNGTSKHKVVINRFEAFRKSWKCLADISKKLNMFQEICPINSQSKLTDSLILDKQSIPFQLLSRLVDIQNQFLDHALAFSFESENLNILRREENVAVVPTMSVTDTRHGHYVNIKTNLTETVANWAYCDLEYGHGRNVHYDLDQIERDLVTQLLVGKVYICLDTLPEIIFIDHMYRQFSTLVQEIHNSTNQKSLPNKIARLVTEKIEKRKTSATDLIHYLDMVMTLLRKTKYDSEEMSLVDFAKTKSDILGRPFPQDCIPSPESCIKVCHIVSLHELLEEICAYPLLDGLEQSFCSPLDPDIQEHFKSMPGLYMSLAETTLNAMKRLAYRCLSMRIVKPEQPLINFLKECSFWPKGSLSNGVLKVGNDEKKVEYLIPSSVQMCHVRGIVFTLAEEIEKIKQGEQNINKLVREHREQKAAHSREESRRKTVARLRMK